MSKTTGDDILNLDFDPDVLIDLIGKLSIDAIPFDVSDTLLKLESKTETSMLDLPILPDCYPNPFGPYFAPPCEQTEMDQPETCPPVNIEKERFLSSIGLGPRAASKPQPERRASGKELSYILNRLEPLEPAYDPVPEDPPSSPYAPVFAKDDVLSLPNEEFDDVVKSFLSNLCDKNTPVGEMALPPVTLSDFQSIAESDLLPTTAVAGCQPPAVLDFLPADVLNSLPQSPLDYHLLCTPEKPLWYTQRPAGAFRSTATSDCQSTAVSDFHSTAASGFRWSDFRSSATSDSPSTAMSDFRLPATSDFPSTATSDFQSTALSDFRLPATSDFPSTATSNFQSTALSDFPSSATSDFQSAAASYFQSSAAPNFQSPGVSHFQPAATSDFRHTVKSDHTFNPPFHDLFQNPPAGGFVDIDLSTYDFRPKYELAPPPPLNEGSSDSDGSFPSLGSQEGLCSENSQASSSSSDKCVSSPDSGYTSCSSVISPSSLTDDTLYELSEEDDQQLNELVAALIEVENNQGVPLGACLSAVPVLSGLGDPEDYKERILNFLKEPLSAERPSSPKPDAAGPEQLLKKDEEVFRVCEPSPKTAPRLKEGKPGFEYRYASKSELRHSSLLSKLKLHTEKSKILKQIQDEREQKRQKMIQFLDRKLKRAGTPAEDIENKRRKVQ